MAPDPEKKLSTPPDQNIPAPYDASNVTSPQSPAKEVLPTYEMDVFSGGYEVEEIANNDGSIIETLDTAFHDTHGYTKEHSLAGSNRAEYYESRSNGKSDVEEELDELSKQHPE